MQLASLEQFKNRTDRNVLALQEAKRAGKKVVGQYCIYSPSEIALAAGAVTVSLCGTKDDSIPIAETILPRGLCPLIKSSFGFALQDSCPYLAASDVVVADTTCDGKKKMYELLNEHRKVFLLQLPQIQDKAAREYWREQYVLLVHMLEEEFNIQVTEEKLLAAIQLSNRLRTSLKRVLDLAKRKPSPLTGLQLLEITFRVSFMTDYEEAIRHLDAIHAAYSQVQSDIDPHAPRILLTGVPSGMGSHKVLQLLEECGASVVCVDNCSCYKKVRLSIPETGDLLGNLASRYLDVPCSVMSPNPHRYTAIEELVHEFAADAVVDLTWQGCQTYDVESWSLKRFVRESLNIPFLQIVTDYSQSDIEQLKVRIEAFLEMI
jgi:benzoyl-CoA reductase/2-hydroxyglutaryl-CoA dehydratase subunit BcrC/BadD/HgdB